VAKVADAIDALVTKKQWFTTQPRPPRKTAVAASTVSPTLHLLFYHVDTAYSRVYIIWKSLYPVHASKDSKRRRGLTFSSFLMSIQEEGETTAKPEKGAKKGKAKEFKTSKWPIPPPYLFS
jgi:hypothetical protein